MVWNNLETSIRNELDSFGIDSSIEFLDAALDERIDRPTLVRGDSIGIARPVDEFSEVERGMVKSEAVSDILAYEAGLSSPGTVSSLDWDELSTLYDEQERGELSDFLPGTDDAQRRVNGCLLIRDRGEQMRTYATRLSSYIEMAESMDLEALKILFSAEEPLFQPGPPNQYLQLLDLVRDHERRKDRYDEIRNLITGLNEASEVTETGRKVLNEFYDHVPQIELSDRLVDRSIEDTASDINREYVDLLQNVDDKKMAAALLYQSVGIQGSDSIMTEAAVKPFNFSKMDYVTNNVLENTEYLSGVVAEKYLSGQDMDTAYRNAVKEFLTE